MDLTGSLYSGSTELTLPLARIKRIAKMDPEVKNIQRDALLLLTKATEMFIAYSALRTAQLAARRGTKASIRSTDFISLVHSAAEQFHFLKSDFPRRILENKRKADDAAETQRSVAKEKARLLSEQTRSDAGGIYKFFGTDALLYKAKNAPTVENSSSEQGGDGSVVAALYDEKEDIVNMG